jgi:hypothetical protein
MVRAYAVWVDFHTSDVHMFSFKEKRFVNVDETTYDSLYKEAQVAEQ